MKPSVFISADWSIDSTKRSVHVADLEGLSVRAEGGRSWNLSHLVALAERLADRGPVLIGIDVAFGLPDGFWRLARTDQRWTRALNFTDWLVSFDFEHEIWKKTASTPNDWSVDCPFFAVQKGVGGLGGFTSLIDGGMRRRIDVETSAKPIFATRGIPGTVGSGTRALWRELSHALRGERSFGLWPFEGDLASLLARRRIVLAETYPGLAYAVALAQVLPAPRLRVAKTQSEVRGIFCKRLVQASWIGPSGVSINGLETAAANEDAFDSLMTAAAVLRCVVENRPLCDQALVDDQAEGGMLLAGPVDLALPARTFAGNPSKEDQASIPIGLVAPLLDTSRIRIASLSSQSKVASSSKAAGVDLPLFPCPIPGCTKVFKGSRGGWDSHAASLRTHPEWHPDVTEPQKRKVLFCDQYSQWFAAVPKLQ